MVLSDIEKLQAVQMLLTRYIDPLTKNQHRIMVELTLKP